MRIFLAGATGVIGRRLLPTLIRRGHEVVGMTRNPERVDDLTSTGARAVVCDVFDEGAVRQAVGEARPDVLIHQLTSLPATIHPRKIATELAANDRIRIEGTRSLVGAAVEAGVQRIVAQSIAFAYAPVGSPIKDEEAPLWLDAPWPWRRSVEAISRLERQVMSAGGEAVVLRYGSLYGPGTAYAGDGAIAGAVRRRQFPIAGTGSGIFSFVHLDDAVRATVSALTRGSGRTYNIVDDEPAPVRTWLPYYAATLGAPPPRKVGRMLARLLAGRHGLYLLEEQRGATNQRARDELNWTPSIPTWKSGFRAPAGSLAERL